MKTVHTTRQPVMNRRRYLSDRQRLSKSAVYHLVTLQAEQTRHGAQRNKSEETTCTGVYSQRERRLLCDPMLTNTCFRNVTAGQIDG